MTRYLQERRTFVCAYALLEISPLWCQAGASLSEATLDSDSAHKKKILLSSGYPGRADDSQSHCDGQVTQVLEQPETQHEEYPPKFLSTCQAI